MEDQRLFFEDLQDALREAVRVCGGTKVVGCALWPEKSPEAAGRLLSDCLNPHRAERLAPEQFLLILRKAHAKGYHRAMEYVAESVGYQALAVEPEDERAMLQRKFNESAREMSELVRRMERLTSASLRSAA